MNRVENESKQCATAKTTKIQIKIHAQFMHVSSVQFRGRDSLTETFHSRFGQKKNLEEVFISECLLLRSLCATVKSRND